MNVPKEWIEMGARALLARIPDDPEAPWDDDDWSLFCEESEAVLTAALPLIREALAQQVTEAIVPTCGPVLDPFDGCGHRQDGMRRAARIIRGGAQ